MIINFMIKSEQKFIFIIYLMCFILNGCVHKTVQNSTTKSTPNVPIHVQQRVEILDALWGSLGSLEETWVDWRYADNTVKSTLIFKCWKFTNQKSCNMLEIMPVGDNPKFCVYDFDEDAIIDAIEKCSSFK